MDGVQLLTLDLCDAVRAEALASPRRRKIFNFHSSPHENVHRMLNVLTRGTYCQPHRHLSPPKAESFLVLEGRAGLVLFDEHGNVAASHELNAQGPIIGIDLAPGLIHTILALSDTAVCYEVKPGPWDPATDKDFAPWAPPEGDPRAPEFLSSWESLFEK
jgi:cupin fold WbuC family metalloprotein